MIRLSKSSLSLSEKVAVQKVLEKEFLGMGTEVKKFEDNLSEFFGRSVVCVNSGTAALHLALDSLDVQKGDEVLVQSLTYVASYQAITATGAKPISCDVEPLNLTIDVNDAEKKITENTKVIMPVHYSGGVGNLDKCYKLAEKYNLRVVEDAAHAFGSNYKGKLVGSFGDISCFSFDGIKNITSGEGGCLVSNNEDVISKARDSRLLGVENDTVKRFSGKRSWEFEVSRQGWRYHMSDIMAAIGNAQLRRFPGFLKKRQTLAKYYDERLSELNEVEVIPHNYDEIVPHIYVVKINQRLKRKNIQDMLLERGIQTGIHYFPNHRLSFFKTREDLKLKIVDKVFSSLFSLPLHTDLTKRDINFICDSLEACLKEEGSLSKS